MKRTVLNDYTINALRKERRLALSLITEVENRNMGARLIPCLHKAIVEIDEAINKEISARLGLKKQKNDVLVEFEKILNGEQVK